MTATKRNLGYGNDGRGGPGGDAAPIDTTNPNDSRSQSEQGSVPTVPDPLPITDFDKRLGDAFPVERFLFQGQLDEIIVGHAVILVEGVEFEQQDNINIAKPPQFRKSVIDTGGEENDDGEVISYAPEPDNLQGTRLRGFGSNGGVVVLTEKIDPPYAVGDTIIASRSLITGVAGVSLQDLNVQARRWKNVEPRTKYAQITKINKDTLDCREWDFATNAQKVDSEGVLLDEILVAKIHDLRGSTWAGKTIGGVDYTVDGGTAETDSHTKRDGIDTGPNPDVTEDQEVIPPWFVDESIIKIELHENGTGAFHNNVQAIWEDTNGSGRAFSEEFVAA